MSLQIQKVNIKEELLKKKKKLEELNRIFSTIRKLNEKIDSFEEKGTLDDLLKEL